MLLNPEYTGDGKTVGAAQNPPRGGRAASRRSRLIVMYPADNEQKLFLGVCEP